MTDNEKRAHDIAIASIPILYGSHKNNVAANPSMEEEARAFDVYKQYISSYNLALELVGRDFSD